jgi:hypothetical protein
MQKWFKLFSRDNPTPIDSLEVVVEPPERPTLDRMLDAVFVRVREVCKKTGIDRFDVQARDKPD